MKNTCTQTLHRLVHAEADDRQPAAADLQTSKRPRFFYVFVHDDISPKDRGALDKNYLNFTATRTSSKFQKA
jgi:hypothetical protein